MSGFPQGGSQARGGIDLSKYQPVSKVVNYNSSDSATYKEFFRANAEGYLSIAYAEQTSGTTDSTKIKVTIDDNVVFWSSAAAQTNSTAGVFIGLSSLLSGDMKKTVLANSPTNAAYSQLNVVDYPLATETAYSIIILSEPLFFKKSCVIEFSRPTAITSGRIAFFGGVKRV